MHVTSSVRRLVPVFTQKRKSSDDVEAVALSADGNTVIVGGPYDQDNAGNESRTAWVFTRSAGVWTQQGAKIVGTGYVGYPLQGFGVSLSADGNTALVGGYNDNSSLGAAWVFTRS